MNRPIKLLLADDHALVRDVLAQRLAREADLRVVAQAADADEALWLALERRPDIVLMDIDMPGTVCFDAVRQMSAELPLVRVVFVSAHVNDRHIEAALDVGAAGYVAKSADTDELLTAIRAVAAGMCHFSASVSERLIVGDGGVTLAGKPRSRLATLTPRELDVLRCTARGMSQKVIAEQLGISVRTIHSHVQNLMAKLDIHDRVELTRFAIREGLAQA